MKHLSLILILVAAAAFSAAGYSAVNSDSVQTKASADCCAGGSCCTGGACCEK